MCHFTTLVYRSRTHQVGVHSMQHRHPHFINKPSCWIDKSCYEKKRHVERAIVLSFEHSSQASARKLFAQFKRQITSRKPYTQSAASAMHLNCCRIGIYPIKHSLCAFISGFHLFGMCPRVLEIMVRFIICHSFHKHKYTINVSSSIFDISK